MIDERVEELPIFEFDNENITISGKSIPYDARSVWGIFVKQMDFYIQKRTSITLNFKLDIFNSSSSLFLTEIFEILTNNRHKITPCIKWYYYEADEHMQELGEIYKELYTKIEFHLIER